MPLASRAIGDTEIEWREYGIAGDEVPGVGEHEVARRRVDVGAFRIHDLRADGKRRRLAALRQTDCFVGVEQPGMEQIDVARAPFERVFVGQARRVVLGREACDVVGRLDRLPHRALREIRRRRVTAALAEVHRDAQPLVARVLDRLDLALAHRDRQPGRFADLARRVRRAQGSSYGQCVLREFAQSVVGNREDSHAMRSPRRRNQRTPVPAVRSNRLGIINNDDERARSRRTQPQRHHVPPSKTQRKKDMHALQALGAELVRLRRDQLQRIDLPDELREAVEFAHRVTSHEGRRRHMQYLGKLMRHVDADAIRAAIARVTGESRAAVALMHLAERWRDRLIADDAALTEFIAAHPAADVQWLRATIRAARRESAMQQAPRHARELYRWLHEQLENPATHEG